MNKTDLFKKYNIDESHATWQPTPDNLMSVEVYRVMHNGKLPEPGDTSCQYILDFLDKAKDPAWFFSLPNNGSLYLTAKRMLYRYADQILKEQNQ